MQDLESLLKDDDVEVRREALENRRSRSGNSYIINLLLSAMEDMSWRVRNTATDILLDEHPVETYIGGLIRLLYREDNAGARNSAIEALVKLNKKATPFLIEAFNTPNRDVRKFIMDILGGFKDSRSLPLMLNALKDDDENVRATAIEHIGKVGESSVVDVLIEDSSKTIQEDALRGIERFYHKGVSEEFITGEIKRLLGDRVLDILVTHAWSKKPYVRIAAILILGLMKEEKAYNPLLEISQDEDFKEEAKRAFVFIGKDRPESLLKLFETNDLYQKRFICEVAGRIASPVYYTTMEKLLEDEDGHIRSIAAKAISKLGSLKAIEPLKRLLADPYKDVQEAAVEALSNLSSGLSVNELIDMLDSLNPALRKNTAMLLGKIGATEAVQALGFRLKDENTDVRKAVVEAFSHFKTEDSIRFLILTLTDEEPDIRVLSALSLGHIGGEGIFEALSLLLSDSDDSVRVAASKALGMLKDARAIRPLMGLLTA